MARRTIAIVTNGVTGRMGRHRHRERPMPAIRARGGLGLGDGDVPWPEPTREGRSAEPVLVARALVGLVAEPRS